MIFIIIKPETLFIDSKIIKLVYTGILKISRSSINLHKYSSYYNVVGLLPPP